MKNASKEVNDFLEVYKELNISQNHLTKAIRGLRKQDLDDEMIELLEIQANFLERKNKALKRILEENKGDEQNV